MIQRGVERGIERSIERRIDKADCQPQSNMRAAGEIDVTIATQRKLNISLEIRARINGLRK